MRDENPKVKSMHFVNIQGETEFDVENQAKVEEEISIKKL